MLTPQEAKTIFDFLNRCAITGHQERMAMNLIVNKLENIANPPPEPEEPDDD